MISQAGTNRRQKILWKNWPKWIWRCRL